MSKLEEILVEIRGKREYGKCFSRGSRISPLDSSIE
jgi:hypothetical protein